MQLREYLFRKRISITDFAKMLDCCRGHVNQIVVKNRKPSMKLAKKIRELTDGAVEYHDMLIIDKEEKERRY